MPEVVSAALIRSCQDATGINRLGTWGAAVARQTLADQVRDLLLSDLFAGRFASGEKLPNEDVLGERFEVSRATVREAVRGLVEAGYLSRVHGSGTYVTGAPPRQHALEATLSYREMIVAAGAEPGLEILRAEVRAADTEESVRLDLVDQDVLVVERVRTADGKPVVYSYDRLPVHLLPVPLDVDGLDPSLYALLAACGHEVRSASARLLPVVADSYLARVLGVKLGTPLQHIDETDYDVNGKPVLVSAEWHVADVFELRINRRAAGS